MKVKFQNPKERLEFCIIYFNIKRMYREMYLRNQLFRDYKHDEHHGAISWFITEVKDI